MVPTRCCETIDKNQWPRNVNEVVSQSSIVQYFHELSSQEDLIETTVEHAVVYEKLFHLVKYANVTKLSTVRISNERYLKISVFRETRRWVPNVLFRNSLRELVQRTCEVLREC